MIYIVEDDIGIRDLVIYTLGVAGFEGMGWADSTGFWEAVKAELPELILLDIMLPGEDGITILKKLRADPRTAAVPVIMATAKGTEYDRVTGLDLGADDYLCKPFGMREMVSRIKAVLRRSGTAAKSRVLSRGAIRVDDVRHIVTANGREVTLTLKEYEILKLLIENPGEVFSRERLLSTVWEVDYLGATRTVDVHIGTLRTKLGEAGELIRTVRGVGYRMD